MQTAPILSLQLTIGAQGHKDGAFGKGLARVRSFSGAHKNCRPPEGGLQRLFGLVCLLFYGQGDRRRVTECTGAARCAGYGHLIRSGSNRSLRTIGAAIDGEQDCGKNDQQHQQFCSPRFSGQYHAEHAERKHRSKDRSRSVPQPACHSYAPAAASRSSYS